jgi:hypothetical protein
MANDLTHLISTKGLNFFPCYSFRWRPAGFGCCEGILCGVAVGSCVIERGRERENRNSKVRDCVTSHVRGQTGL